VVEVLKKKKVAVISDTTGYGTASVNAYVPMLKQMGAEVVYQGNVDAANPDLKPEILRMQAAGAEAIMPWSVNAGFLSRIINTRGQLAWDVPICGQTTLGSGQTKALLEKPEYWGKVYPNNFRPVCYRADGSLPDRTKAFVDRLRSAKIDMGDTLLWWIALGYDTPHLIADAIRKSGAEPEKIVAHWNKLKDFPGVYGEISFTPDEHNGYPDRQIVMVEANSLKEGAFNLAPGYGAS
jgi:branched-chain amino acid transport system substrate-binding protein